MASEQARRENVTDERHVVVEREKVPKMATHFESLAEKARDEQQQQVPPWGEKESGLQVSGTGEGDSGRKRREDGQKREEMQETEGSYGGDGEGRQGYSLKEISNLRATVEQNSVEAIRAAEAQYEKGKAAKDAAGSIGEKTAATEEKAAGHAASKKAEAQKDLEARRASHDQMGNKAETTPSKEEDESKEQIETRPEDLEELLYWGSHEQGQQQQGGSILRAIGETIVEIGQMTKELLTGECPIRVLEPNNKVESTGKHHPGAGEGT